MLIDNGDGLTMVTKMKKKASNTKRWYRSSQAIVQEVAIKEVVLKEVTWRLWNRTMEGAIQSDFFARTKERSHVPTPGYFAAWELFEDAVVIF